MSSVLLFDVGNQRLKWACVSLADLMAGGKNRFGQLCRSASYRSGVLDLFDEDNALAPLDSLKRETTGVDENIVLILASSVARNQVPEHLSRFCMEAWDQAPEFVTTIDSIQDFENGYDKPAQLGTDRWLAACAARQLVNESDSKGESRAVIVIDAGTAVTVDLVLGRKFLGGSILPGYGTIIRTLSSKTGQIRIDADMLARQQPTEELDSASSHLIATNSDAAVQAGAVAAVAGGVRHVVEKLQAGLSSQVVICVSGGDAIMASADLDMPYRNYDNIVLTGLAMEAERKFVSIKATYESKD